MWTHGTDNTAFDRPERAFRGALRRLVRRTSNASNATDPQQDGTVADALEIVLGRAVAPRLFESAAMMQLAFVGADGAPRVAPTDFAWDGTRFLLCSRPDAPRVFALSDDPRVAATIELGASTDALLIRGTAAIELVEKVRAPYAAAKRRRLGAEAFSRWERDVRSRHTTVARIALTPTWARLVDLRALG